MATPTEKMAIYTSGEIPPGAEREDILTVIDGSQEPFFELKNETFFAQIAQNRELSPQQRASLIASGMLDNISIMLNEDRAEWPDADDLAEAYEMAEFLTATKGSDDTDIVIEIYDEELQEEGIPKIYGEILAKANKGGKHLTLGKSGEIAAMMIRLWLVTEADIDIPTLFIKIKGRAAGRLAIKNSRAGFKL